MDHTLMLTDQADEADRLAIVRPLVAYNDSRAGPSQGRPVVVLVRDAAEQVVGGLWGHTAYEWLFTQYLALPTALRGRGVGTRIMQLAETEAAARGCHGAWVDTFEFQARGFYERLGYTCFGELPEYPRGASRYFLQKALIPAAT